MSADAPTPGTAQATSPAPGVSEAEASKTAASSTTASSTDSSETEAPSAKKTSSVWRDARQLVWQRRGRLGIGLVLIGISRLAGLVLPASSKVFIDNVLGEGRSDLLFPLAGAVVVAALIQSTTSFGLSQLLGIAAWGAITEMRKSLQQRVVRLPVSFFDSTKSGVLISRVMTDAEGIRNLVGTGLVQMIGGLLTASIALGILFYLNWQMTAFILVILLLFGGFMAMAFRWVRPLFRERREINAEITGRLGETLGGTRIVKAYTAEKREDRIFAHGVHQLLRNVGKSITAVSAVSAGTSLIFGIVGAVIMVFGGRAVAAGTMTPGDIVSYVLFTGMVAAPMVQISSVGTQLGEAIAGLDRIREIRAHPTELDEDADRQPLRQVTGDIVFDAVEFEYDPGVPVLKGVSFEAKAGTTTALVGSSGSGKSTLISLVMAFNRPQTGRVLIDGQDLDDLKLLDYRSHLGIVLQENFLFDGSVAENIAYGRPYAPREEIEAAGRVANCHEFVEGFAEGYDTVVGERGVKLSGGQRQRIAIARAILADPRILILDEATSSLDSESEAMIQEGLESLRQGRTTFVIAHRLSTIRSADQILVLEEGQIVERGTHEELYDLEGRYRELHDRQYKLESNRFINPGEDFTPEPEKPKAAKKARRSSL